ncbi:hypothetical protein CAOG_04908 [Capsaspora owczarzaki ATCC 30864]|uniref:Uncharacterized protein n=1 Tax=Capsaspora owczarzaki (strain ATCC 30864) TaxID=595528 RepID=A0A0D2WQZ9_CAPO3|nr:hypothetical protein CAOG_04908 [Capsaspora owczarzaki ATCC 30864]KJE94235.1 hypothetical protein CAOG_004908 [Capsaspora owczarzaki ATCC 30864]|eukprot:XP_004347659.1 hypothetical protein CAOG_04908 [Capsaspora owczarzaki ATCC 30864]
MSATGASGSGGDGSKPLPRWLAGFSVASFVGGMAFSRLTMRVAAGVAVGTLIGMVIEQEYGMPDVKAMHNKIAKDARIFLQPAIDHIDDLVRTNSDRVEEARRPDRRDR